MIDYGEQLTKELEDTRTELYKQVTSMGRKLQLLWEVVRTSIVFIIPILAGIGLTFLSQCYLPRSLAIFLSTISNGVTIGLVFLNITPLNEAINNYVESRLYTPSFVDCSCKTCHNQNNCSSEHQGNYLNKQEEAAAEPKRTNESSTDNGKQGPYDQSSATVTIDTTGSAALDNDETLRKRNVGIESNYIGNNGS